MEETKPEPTEQTLQTQTKAQTRITVHIVSWMGVICITALVCGVVLAVRAEASNTATQVITVAATLGGSIGTLLTNIYKSDH